MAETSWDTIIVGRGLAGTTLAWHLEEAGQRVLVIDANEPVTSSKIAAGLITPITGQRLVLSWNIEQFLPAARTFYRRAEQRTGKKFFHDRVALRLFKSEAEQQKWSVRSLEPDYKPHVVDAPPAPLIDRDVVTGTNGGFAMHAAQLDVAYYLDASQTVLDCEEATIDWAHDVSFSAGSVTVKGHRADRVISCEGYAVTRNPYFQFVPFLAAKGDILTVRFHSPVPPHSLHRGIWVAPTADPDVFRVGSTYEWETLDQVPSAQARAELEEKLKQLVRVAYTVEDHQAAVRPIINESKALIGLHREQDRLGFFNGLGSKGALLAPWYAERFADFLTRQVPLPDWLDVAKKFA